MVTLEACKELYFALSEKRKHFYESESTLSVNCYDNFAFWFSCLHVPLKKRVF